MRIASIARRLVVLVTATVVLLAAPGYQLAYGHDDDALDTTPGAGETVQSVADIVVDFAGPVDGERFEVVDPSGERVEGTTSVTDDGVATFAPAAAVATEGEYTVRYVAQSADGHLVSGEFAFTVGEGEPDSGGSLRWIAAAAAVVATLSVAAAATIVRRKTDLSHGAGPNVTP